MNNYYSYYYNIYIIYIYIIKDVYIDVDLPI